ncbi:hypothetical protein EOT10_14950 [Streptomyces antnestii]|uniref:EF-hand domain-containing protein n=1 Tax=Streptomyces antnestii TaxID=2494256 RepID=A0A437PPV7_9ACTN|nr:hypothetical protein [Streptomyces sp. San01]RVU24325.1 hypothetical protein EOT10_14950 [Streptomyces sp. San01]
MRLKLSKRKLFMAGAAGVVAAVTAVATAVATPERAGAHGGDDTPVEVEVHAPARGDVAGAEGKGWFVDLEVDYPGGQDGLHKAGFSGLQLTGPAGHNNVPPFPGTFSPGKDDRLPGLVVLGSTTVSRPGTKFAGPGTNLANLFNMTGVTDRTADETELWDTWIVGDSILGKDVDTVLTVAVVDDLDHNGVYDDAPDTVTDENGDGRVDAADLKALGVASEVEKVPFHLNGNPAS